MKRNIVGVLLAAGQSSRFGSNKLLYPLKTGTVMAVATARHLLTVLPNSFAVVDSAQSELANLLQQEGLSILVNPHAEQGMGTSIACGVSACKEAQGWIIALADMPFIPATIIQELVNGLDKGAEIIAPVYQGQRGHPVGFSSTFVDELMQLHSDEGARSIIEAHREQLVLHEVKEKGVTLDIDKLNDLNTL